MNTINKVLFILMFPLGLMAQEIDSEEEIIFDQEHFLATNYDILETFANNIYDSSSYVTCIMVSKKYELDGLGKKGSHDLLVIETLLERKGEATAVAQEKLIVQAGKELFTYLANNLNPQTIICFRKLNIEEVQVNTYVVDLND